MLAPPAPVWVCPGWAVPQRTVPKLCTVLQADLLPALLGQYLWPQSQDPTGMGQPGDLGWGRMLEEEEEEEEGMSSCPCGPH